MSLSKLLLAAVAALALCGPASAAEPVKLRQGWVVAPADSPLFMFGKKGITQHEGKSYTLDMPRFQGTPPMITALATNELEIGNLAYSSLSLAIENAGMTDLRVIADEFQDGVAGYSTNEFLVLEDSPIKTVQDLKGKVLATNAAGSAIDIAMRAMLRKNKLDDKRDVTIIEAAFPNMRAMLQDHKIDVFPAVLPFLQDPDIRKGTRTLFTQKEAMGTSQMIVWAAREGFLKAHRAALVDFMEDVLRLQHWYLDPANRKEVLEIAVRISKRPASAFESWLFTDKDYYRDRQGKPDLDALQANIKLQKELGLLKSEFDVRKYADLSIVEDAAKRLK
jgi:NitT/TauT family transport system substrate-binding protein